jgi:hypothetical protein
VGITEINPNEAVRSAQVHSVHCSHSKSPMCCQVEIVAAPGDNFFHVQVPVGQTVFATSSNRAAEGSFAARM